MTLGAATSIGHGGHGHQEGQGRQKSPALHLYNEKEQNPIINNDARTRESFGIFLFLILIFPFSRPFLSLSLSLSLSTKSWHEGEKSWRH